MVEIVGRLGDQPIYRTAIDEAVRLQVKEESRMEGRTKDEAITSAIQEMTEVSEAIDKYGDWLEKEPISDEALTQLEKRLDQVWRDCGWPDERHYGIWSVSRGWWSTPSRMEVWAVTDKAMAHAQLDVVNQHYSEYEYQVRCIEEWYETMEGPA